MLEHMRRMSLTDGAPGQRTLIILIAGSEGPTWDFPADTHVRLYTSNAPQGVDYAVVEVYQPPSCPSVLLVLKAKSGARNAWLDRTCVRANEDRCVERVEVTVPGEGKVTLKRQGVFFRAA